MEVVINCPEASDKVDRIVSALRNLDEKLSGVKEGQTYLIDQGDVYYFESVDKRCFIYTAKDIFETALKLYEIEDRFTDMGFFRCSKSQIINIAKIESLCPDFGGRIEAKMENGEKLVVSRQYTKSLRERLGLK